MFDLGGWVLCEDRGGSVAAFNKANFLVKVAGKVMDHQIEKMVINADTREIYVGDCRGHVKILGSDHFNNKKDLGKLMDAAIKEIFIVDHDLVVVDQKNCMKFLRIKNYQVIKEFTNQDGIRMDKMICNNKDLFIFYPKVNKDSSSKERYFSMKVLHLYLFSNSTGNARNSKSSNDLKKMIEKKFLYNYLI